MSAGSGLGRQYYPYEFKGSFPFYSNKVKIINHSFVYRTDDGFVYNTSIHEYLINKSLSVFAIKFRRKNDKSSKCKGYQKTYKYGTREAFKIIFTNMEIFYEIVNKYKGHIYGFHGVWDVVDVDRQNYSGISRRHSVWIKCCLMYFPDDYFDYMGRNSTNLLFFKNKDVEVYNWKEMVLDSLVSVHNDFSENTIIPKKIAEYRY